MSKTLGEMKAELFDDEIMNKIHNMDCLEFMKKVPDDYFDLIVTDSPYKLVQGGCTTHENGSFLKGVSLEQHKSGKLFDNNNINFSDWLPDVYRILKEGTHFYSMVNDRNIEEMIRESKKCGFHFLNMLVWNKGNIVMNRYYMKQTEFICFFRKGRAKNINDMGTSNLISFPNNIGNKAHPSEKPQKLFEIFVANSSNKGDKVFDPFMGSGTTAVACKSLGLDWCGCELEADYVEIANKRLEQVQGALF